MSNIAGKAYGMNVLTPVKPGLYWLQVFLFMLSRSTPSQLKGLLGLRLIHFARWVMIRKTAWPRFPGMPKHDLQHDQMLFLSNFNGTWDQYIDAFADGIPSGLDLFWYTAIRYPQSIPIGAFKAYITQNQVDTNYYYNATPGAAQRDITCALQVRQVLIDLQATYAGGACDPDTFAVAYREAITKIQNCLGAHGVEPLASVATKFASANRRRFLAQFPDMDGDKPRTGPATA